MREYWVARVDGKDCDDFPSMAHVMAEMDDDEALVAADLLDDNQFSDIADFLRHLVQGKNRSSQVHRREHWHENRQGPPRPPEDWPSWLEWNGEALAD